MTDQEKVKAKWPKAHEFHFADEWTIVDGVHPSMRPNSWLSGQRSKLEEAWADAAKRLEHGEVR